MSSDLPTVSSKVVVGTPPAWDAVVVGAAAVASLALFEVRGKVPFTSDQGIISLMALDILERGSHPVFCYGSEYGGTVEAHVLAAAFGLFGATPAVFRTVMAVATVSLAIVVWAVARKAFGRRAGFLAGLYFSLGPPYLLYKFLTSDGGYVSLELASALALLALLVADERGRRGRPALVPLAAFGFFVGLAWWILPLAATLIIACALAVALAWRRTPAAWAVVAASVSAIVGAFPWLYHNLRTGWLSLRTPEMGLANASEIAASLEGLVRFGWPILLGAWHVWRPDPVPWVSAVVALGLFSLLAGSGVRRVLREPAGAARFALVLLLGMALLPAGLSVLARRTEFHEPRYLLLSYLGIAPLAGGLLDAIWPRRGPRVALLSLLFVLGPVSQWAAPDLVNRDVEGLGAEPTEIVAALEAQRADRIYASYWIAYRLTFLSRETIVMSPFGSETHGAVRASRLARIVDASPAPGFLLNAEDRGLFESYLQANGVPCTRTDVGGLRLYRDLPAPLVARLRSTRSLPFQVAPGDLEWGTPRGPSAVPTGSSAVWEIPLTVRWSRRLPQTIHASYHWERLDGEVLVFDGERSGLPAQALEGPWPMDVRTKVLANVPPGLYRLRFDLVHESWFWFASLGIASPSVTVHVTGPSAPDGARERRGT